MNRVISPRLRAAFISALIGLLRRRQPVFLQRIIGGCHFYRVQRDDFAVKNKTHVFALSRFFSQYPNLPLPSVIVRIFIRWELV